MIPHIKAGIALLAAIVLVGILLLWLWWPTRGSEAWRDVSGERRYTIHGGQEREETNDRK